MGRFGTPSQVSRSLPFDNSSNGFSATNAQAAIEEARLLNPNNIVYVDKSGNDGTATGRFNKPYLTISAAIASITTASSTNQFLILVAPGVYTESQLVMKNFVSIQGQETQSVIIQPSDQTNHLIIGAAMTLRFLTIKGVTTAGKAGIYSNASGLQVRNCVVRDNPINIYVEGTSSLASITADSNIITGTFTTGIWLKNAGAGVIGIFSNSVVNAVSANSGAKCSISEGANVSFIFASVVASGVSTVNGFTVKDGAVLKVLAEEIKGFAKAIWVENVGSAPMVDILSANLDSNTIDFQNDHPTASGAFSGVAEFSKIVNAAPNTLSFTYQDPVVGDFNVSKTLHTKGFATDVHVIASASQTTQLLSTDPHTHIVTGSTSGQIVKLPDATTLRVGHQHWIINSTSVQVTAKHYDNSNAITLFPSGSVLYILQNNSTQAGIWNRAIVSSSPFQGTSQVICGYGASAGAGRFLDFISGNSSDVSPFVAIVPVTVVGMSMGGVGNSTCTISLFKNGDFVNSIAQLSTSGNNNQYTNTLNVPISQGDLISVQVTSGSINKPFVAIYLSGV